MTALVMKCLVELNIVSVKDYLRFLRNTNTNHALYYYWTILDMLLSVSNDTTDYVDLFSVCAPNVRECIVHPVD